MADLFSLSHKVEHTMLYELQDVGYTVRPVELDVALLLTDKSLVALRVEQFPGADEILHNIDVRASLDVKVASIEESTDIQAGNELVGFILGVGRGALMVQVEVVALRRLEVTLLERFAMPRALASVTYM